MNRVTANTAEAPAIIGCLTCAGSGFRASSAHEFCLDCGGTGNYGGILNAWGQRGIDAVGVEPDRQDTSLDPRCLVRLDTFTCETMLTINGAKALIAQLHRVIDDLQRAQTNQAFAAAIAAGEEPLKTVRDQLGAWAFNCLARSGVLTVEQAAAMSDKELLAIANLGSATLRRIRAVVGTGTRSAGNGPSTTEA